MGVVVLVEPVADEMCCTMQEIHKQISLLNFHDCHTKIRQVDSQATVGDGVVIQVNR